MGTKSCCGSHTNCLEEFSVTQLIEQIPGHFFIKDKEGVFLKSNLHGKRQVETEGKTDFDMPWKEQANELRENDKKVMASKKEMTFTEKLRFNGKDYATFYCVKAPLLDKSGNVIGIIGHATEIKQ